MMRLPSWSYLTRIVATMDMVYRLLFFLRILVLFVLHGPLKGLGPMGQWFYMRETIKITTEGFFEHIRYAALTFLFFANMGLSVLAHLLRDATDPNEENENMGSVIRAELWFGFNSLAVIINCYTEYRFYDNFLTGTNDEVKFDPPRTWMICIEVFLSVLWIVYRIASLIIVEEFAREILEALAYNHRQEQLIHHNSQSRIWDLGQNVEHMLRHSSGRRTEDDS